MVQTATIEVLLADGADVVTAACFLRLLLLQLKYSWFMHGLRQENIQLNRKMLSELAIFEPHSFKALVTQVQHMRGASSSSSASSSISQAASGRS